jgi:U3 small nucleolar RNA-associated protein 6
MELDIDSFYRALQLHPNNPTFYILAASHELDNLSPSAARALLQRGIRVNPDSVDMWKEYVKMELGFMESLRRRWDVLGIKVESGSTGKGKQKATEEDPSRFLMDERSEEVAATYESLDIDIPMEGDTDDGAEARRQILEGAIVISVIESAAQGV